jgi:hypothetical protein
MLVVLDVIETLVVSAIRWRYFARVIVTLQQVNATAFQRYMFNAL